VTVLANDPPVADAGGPYTFDEDALLLGDWTATLDGGGSTDDFGIHSYKWLLDPVSYDFSGTAIDASEWLYADSGVTQNDGITITGAGSWGNRYLFSQKNYIGEGLIFQARVLPENTSGNQHAMWGFKNRGTNYSYTQMSHAICFNNTYIDIYEGGSNRGRKASYTKECFL
jgi:hypothetical protein